MSVTKLVDLAMQRLPAAFVGDNCTTALVMLMQLVPSLANLSLRQAFFHLCREEYYELRPSQFQLTLLKGIQLLKELPFQFVSCSLNFQLSGL